MEHIDGVGRRSGILALDGDIIPPCCIITIESVDSIFNPQIGFSSFPSSPRCLQCNRIGPELAPDYTRDSARNRIA